MDKRVDKRSDKKAGAASENGGSGEVGGNNSEPAMNVSNDLEAPLLDKKVEKSDDKEEHITHDADKFSRTGELRIIAHIAIGYFLSSVSWVIIKTTDTALLGHVGTKYLEAASLSDLYTSCTGSFVFASVVGVFVAQAAGDGNKHLGATWLLVSLACLMVLTFAVMVTWFFTQPVLRLCGVTAELSKLAGYYSAVLALCLPARTICSQLSSYFSAHGVVYPGVQSTVFACIVNLIFGLFFVLGYPFYNTFRGYGFVACPIVTVVTEYSMLLFFVLYFCVYKNIHVQLGWYGLTLKEVTKPRVFEYLRLFVPQALSVSSDFWRVAVIGAFAATLDELDVAVFNTSYRMLWMVLTFVGAVGGAVGIRLSTHLGELNLPRSKEVLKIGTVVSVILLSLLSALLFHFIEQVASLFSSDKNVIDQFYAIRLPLTLMLFFMNLSVFLERVPVAMGKTKQVFYAGLIGSWLGQVPLSFLFMRFVDNSLSGLYWGVAIGYMVSCLLLTCIIIFTNWNAVLEEVKRRNKM